METGLDQNQLPEETPVSGGRSKIVIRNGAVFALLLIIIMLITHMFRDSLSQHTQSIAWGEYVLLLIAIIITQLDVRGKVYNGKMLFGQAFSTGMLFVALVTAIFSVFTLVFYLAIGPDVLNEMKVIAENSLREKGLDEDQIRTQMQFSERIFTPVGMFIMVIIGYLFIGVIMSLLASLFTQRNR